MGELYLLLFNPVFYLLIHALQKLVLFVYSLDFVHLSLHLLDALQLNPLSAHTRDQFPQLPLRFLVQCLSLVVFVLYALLLQESAG